MIGNINPAYLKIEKVSLYKTSDYDFNVHVFIRYVSSKEIHFQCRQGKISADVIKFGGWYDYTDRDAELLFHAFGLDMIVSGCPEGNRELFLNNVDYREVWARL